MNKATERLIAELKEMIADMRGEKKLPTVEEFLEELKKEKEE